MKFTALVVTTLAVTAGVALAADYQPAVRALAAPEPVAPNAAAEPTEDMMQPQPAAAGAAEVAHADKEHAVDKKSKEWRGGYGWGGPWGGYGGWGGRGRWGGWGGRWRGGWGW